MSFITLRNGRRIGDYLKPYIVAELNTSHFGDMDIAKCMIEQAKHAGCDCVKFQSWSADTLYCDSYYLENKIARRIVSKFALDSTQLKELALHAEKIGIDFASTPYSLDEAEFLINECGVNFIKVASMELNNLPFLFDLGRLGLPVVLSTGMGTMDEIVKAVNAIKSAGNRDIIILHCSSVYPALPAIIRLQNILGLRGEFPEFPVGYSDHSVGLEIPCASVALGACLIEKHFTLDSSKIGMDNQMATEPHVMKLMVEFCHNVYESLGGMERLLSNEEISKIPKMRRSIVAKVDLAQGDKIGRESVEFKRPGWGMPPSDFEKIEGKSMARAVKKGFIIQVEDINNN